VRTRVISRRRRSDRSHRLHLVVRGAPGNSRG
jgi:hypothetical protein